MQNWSIKMGFIRKKKIKKKTGKRVNVKSKRIFLIA
jgi:hypothetical protein